MYFLWTSSSNKCENNNCLHSMLYKSGQACQTAVPLSDVMYISLTQISEVNCNQTLVHRAAPTCSILSSIILPASLWGLIFHWLFSTHPHLIKLQLWIYEGKQSLINGVQYIYVKTVMYFLQDFTWNIFARKYPLSIPAYNVQKPAGPPELTISAFQQGWSTGSQ